MTPKELEVFLATYDHFGLKMRAAHLRRFPYALGEWLIVQRERQLRWEEEFEAEEEIPVTIALRAASGHDAVRPGPRATRHIDGPARAVCRSRPGR